MPKNSDEHGTALDYFCTPLLFPTPGVPFGQIAHCLTAKVCAFLCGHGSIHDDNRAVQSCAIGHVCVGRGHLETSIDDDP